MAKYNVTKHYHSAWGSLTRGDVVELDDDIAAWLNRDAPGVVALYVLPPVEPPPEPEPVKAPARAVDAPQAHRMVTHAPTKRGPQTASKAAGNGN